MIKFQNLSTGRLGAENLEQNRQVSTTREKLCGMLILKMHWPWPKHNNISLPVKNEKIIEYLVNLDN